MNHKVGARIENSSKSTQRTARSRTGSLRLCCESGHCDRQVSNARTQVGLALPGARLCRACKEALRRDLARIPWLHAACGGSLTGSDQSVTERVTGTRAIGITLNAEALEVRSSIMRALVSWSAWAVKEFEVDRPCSREVSALAQFLVDKLDWLAAHTVAGSLASEMRMLAIAADRAALGEPPPRRVELGPCAYAGCESVIHSSIPVTGARAGIEVGCDSGHYWPPQQWLSLALGSGATRKTG